MAIDAEVLNGGLGPEAEVGPALIRDALLEQLAGNHAARAALTAGWRIGEEFVEPRAAALADADGGVFVRPQDVERQIGGDVRRRATRTSREGRFDVHLVHAAALLALSLGGETPGREMS